MVRPVRPWPYRFLREKNGVVWIMRYRMTSPSGSPYLGTSKRSSSDFFKSSNISVDQRIEASQFSMAILQRETSSQIGEALTWASCVAVISGSSVQNGCLRPCVVSKI